MEVKVILHGALRDRLPRQARGKTTLTLADGATVAEVLQQFQLGPTVSAAINGVRVDPAHVLQDGDELQVFRMIGGG